MKIFLTGVPGTGKTTIVEQLSKEGSHAKDIDAFSSWIKKRGGKAVINEGKPNKGFTDEHDWICDIQKLKEFMNQTEDTAIIAGAPTNLKEVLGLFDEVIVLQCSPEILIHRLNTRPDEFNDFGKDKETQDFILNTYKNFEKEMLEHGAVPVNADQPFKRVLKEVKLHL